ncbi:endo-alpha-N-acetylgalactosaminidase family protein [Flavihumibacter petaseus]|uniref:Endo-alpha-N-acetylgalactosaminidase domain-containing protein n=1 Tax=Flavihumibacter petaseus NBRC 106054 TaxID=1220578 RepID=A0A0E9N109_9BACT|nr:endo-alpha-N-acetylgalactosaminidase family protein [Flavihumibacter petaseus]GAO43529.1 hypothetical protein FPE01S_02_06340 [Flavihumibacter petaseus NBRC 106054]
MQLRWILFVLVVVHTSASGQQTRWNHRYDQTLVMKIACAIPDNKKGSVVLATFKEVLDLVRRTDQITLEAPKILYLVGWQYNGHDDKYPAFFAVNEHLKRPEDANARESLLWLMREAKKFHTTISLHINMTDAYDDSPLWDTYVKEDMLSKNEDGTLMVVGEYNGKKAYQVNYQREWEKGYAQKRIDSLLHLLPALKEAGTIHLDAWIARDSKGHRESAIQEAAYQQKVGRYWLSRGIEPTSEWVMDYMEGIIPFYWHFNARTTDQYLRQPASVVTGGHFNPDLKRSDFGLEFLFGTSMYGENHFPGWQRYRNKQFDGNWETGFMKDFFLQFPQYAFLNRLQRLSVTGKGENRMAAFSDSVVVSLKDSIIKRGNFVFRNHNQVLFPLTWRYDASYIAYSTQATMIDRPVPQQWKGKTTLGLFVLNKSGWQKEKEIPLRNGRMQFTLEAEKPVLLVPAGAAAVRATARAGDTTFIHHEVVTKIPQRFAYHQTLTYKLMLAEAGFDGKFRRRDNGVNKNYLNAEQALAVIGRLDKITLGMPKIVYLVGWQYNGHDSKYPALFEGNPAIKRSQDKDALESIRWLMKEARKYNTVVSLHINLFDAYEDSPLWDTYVNNNIIARRQDGSLMGGECGYPISYAQEWKTGFLQKRIDSLCSLLPLGEAGTIHVDAFHTWPPKPIQQADGSWRISLDKSITSPFLGFTPEDETKTQEKIYEYFGSKGIDVTSEGVDFLREQSFVQWQSMAWWYNNREQYLKWPASVYCGGEDRSDWGKLFGTSMHVEEEARIDPVGLPGVKAAFCQKTLIWYYLNRLDRLFLVDRDGYRMVQFSGGVKTEIGQGVFRLYEGNALLAEGSDVCMPASWIDSKSMIAYSRDGYEKRTWRLPAAFRKATQAEIFVVTANGTEKKGSTKISKGQLRLQLSPDEMVWIKIK